MVYFYKVSIHHEHLPQLFPSVYSSEDFAILCLKLKCQKEGSSLNDAILLQGIYKEYS